MIRSLSALALLVAIAAAAPSIAEDEDQLVLLPGQGELRDKDLRSQPRRRQGDRSADIPNRLKPGGGLFLSFDTDSDGLITRAEITQGIPLAFAAADANEDNELTALEQQDWAASLPTRDDSLANPARFDPNLDRRVDLAEFTAVIENLREAYADETSGEITLTSLKAPKRRPTRREQAAETLLERRAEAERDNERRN